MNYHKLPKSPQKDSFNDNLEIFTFAFEILYFLAGNKILRQIFLKRSMLNVDGRKSGPVIYPFLYVKNKHIYIYFNP